MLVLSRKPQEAVAIVAGVERMFKVTVLDIRGGRVKLGFDVDADIPVHRWEVWERILTNGPPADAAVSPPL
jgi:carbon storage regulator CsrA